jgi:hypothetical protein
MPEKNLNHNRDFEGNGSDEADDISQSAVPGGMTLENIIDLTGELEHLNELVMLHVEKSGGFTCTESYFCTVQPVLDLLEVEIRFRYHPQMNNQELKLLIQDWIDQEIAELKKC